MTTGFSAWLERDFERRSSGQRAQVEAAKLLSTLAIATAAAFVASALQSGHSRSSDVIAAYLIGGSFIAIVAVILLDRSTTVDLRDLELGALMGQLDEEKELDRLRRDEMISVLNNEAVVRQVRLATGLTLLLALTAAAFAIGSLLS